MWYSCGGVPHKDTTESRRGQGPTHNDSRGRQSRTADYGSGRQSRAVDYGSGRVLDPRVGPRSWGRESETRVSGDHRGRRSHDTQDAARGPRCRVGRGRVPCLSLSFFLKKNKKEGQKGVDRPGVGSLSPRHIVGPPCVMTRSALHTCLRPPKGPRGVAVWRYSDWSSALARDSITMAMAASTRAIMLLSFLIAARSRFPAFIRCWPGLRWA